MYWNIPRNWVSLSWAIKKLSTIKSSRIVEKSLTLLLEFFIYLGGPLAGTGSIGIKGEKDILTEPLWKEDLPLCVVLIDDRVSLLSSIKWTFGMLERNFFSPMPRSFDIPSRIIEERWIIYIYIHFLYRSNEISNLSKIFHPILKLHSIDFYTSNLYSINF